MFDGRDQLYSKFLERLDRVCNAGIGQITLIPVFWQVNVLHGGLAGLVGAVLRDKLMLLVEERQPPEQKKPGLLADYLVALGDALPLPAVH